MEGMSTVRTSWKGFFLGGYREKAFKSLAQSLYDYSLFLVLHDAYSNFCWLYR